LEQLKQEQRLQLTERGGFWQGEDQRRELDFACYIACKLSSFLDVGP
jgi:hypothetical protein